MSAINDCIEMLTRREKVIKELNRLEKFWRNDAAYRPPEDPLRAFAMGNADAYCRARMLVIEMFDDKE